MWQNFDSILPIQTCPGEKMIGLVTSPFVGSDLKSTSASSWATSCGAAASRWTALVVLCCVLTLVSVADSPSPTMIGADIDRSGDPSTIAKWIGELDDPRYSVRRRAQERLVRAGVDAVGPLSDAVQSGDLETILVANRLLCDIAGELPPQYDGGAFEALGEIAERNIGVAGGLATIAIEDVRARRGQNAIRRVSRAGGIFGEAVIVVRSAELRDEYPVLTLPPGFGSTDQTLQWLRWIEGYQKVQLVGETINADVLSAIASRDGRHELFLFDGVLDRSTATALASFDSIELLEIVQCKVEPDALETLLRVPVTGSLGMVGTGLSMGDGERLSRHFSHVQFKFKVGAFMGVRVRTFSDTCTLSEVVPGSAAERAGLMKDDVIVRINDSLISNFDDLERTIAVMDTGREISVEFIRAERLRKTIMSLGRVDTRPVTYVQTIRNRS